MSDYAWIIDKDRLAEPGGLDETGMNGPSDITPCQEAKLKAGEGQKFRMYDDDGELYYEGRIIGDDPTLFEPLDDFGMPNAGCTEIRYLNDADEWETL